MATSGRGIAVVICWLPKSIETIERDSFKRQLSLISIKRHPLSLHYLKAISEVGKGPRDLLSNVRPSLHKPSGLLLAR